uniref:Protein kinase domain-containing protein n=1 Tax=Kalanchoe fedtschenkoi TaxID=63787 RepID=A0A7N0T962_KALFE
MANQADLVIIGVSVGLALGIFIAVLAFFGFRWYRERYLNQRRVNERSLATSQRHINGTSASFDSSASFTCSVDIDGIDTNPTSSQPSWWARRSKDQFISSSGIPRYSYKDIQKGTQNFTTLLGEGSFGPVYRAKMATGEVVAVKVLASNSKQGEKEFQTEVVLLGRLHHRHLVNLLGYCVEKGQHMLVYEYMSNGSLENILYGEQEGSLTWDERLQIALDVSHGIEYLHEGAVPPVIHRDLKSANILLDQSMRAKVADFGLSKEQVADGRNSGLKGTYGYMDPAYISTNKFTLKSDIYSFGIILFELITAIHPHQNLLEYINLAALSYDGVDEILDKRLDAQNVDDVRRLAVIARKCLHKNPRKRPTMSEISQAVLKIKQRRLVKDDTMSFAGSDFSQVVSRIETQHVELSNLAGIKEKPIEIVELSNLAGIQETPIE